MKSPTNNIKHLLLIFLLNVNAISTTILAQDCPEGLNYEKIDIVSRQLNLSCSEASDFIFELDVHLGDIQDKFTQIASASTELRNPLLTKQDLINKVINDFFVSERSVVQYSPTANWNRNDINLAKSSGRTLKVRDYLNRLNHASRITNEKIISIEIDFAIKKDIVAMEKSSICVDENGNPVQPCFEMAVSNWQLYLRTEKDKNSDLDYAISDLVDVNQEDFVKIKNLRANRVRYVDLTQKIFVFNCYKDKNGLWKIRLDAVNAGPAIRPEEYYDENFIKKIDGLFGYEKR